MKKAFSLIELMIVIVIIGVVYTLVITKLHSVNEEQEKLSLKNLKSYMYKQIKDGNSSKLVCEDDCSVCTLYIDQEKRAEIEELIDDSIEVYRYSYSEGLVQQRFKGCFEFEVARDGISDQYIVAFKDKVYDYSEYFKGVKVYDTLQECVDEKEQLIQEVK
ncbi:prepilin-type N-terminal cleavage/methylation domain-containing protein [Sulfurimonas marina]|uniref:Prepilin-type N-terminal cleavage/methylation domain-containing protein n=1 Tax=Sulfurimonas marina TaxID=2590551 RepID=A0A7M1AW91_9BACT|nr:prepilin-type N-terminal cleavage/methylation domain-containing protein [Sulfurimonas marina]QOP41723.1 prepilin-type N-terminal cleavage/methylation domain-containing protein [Sulfurimonas marina]